jgi:serine/threonine-protein kinase
LLTLIGRGATSEVYAAEHALLGDKVAVKLLRPELATDPGQTQALVDEGARVRGIDHANVVRVFDVGVDSATAGCYLVMEHVAGGTLGARMTAPLPEAEVRRLGAAIADGIAAAHARGIVHRDLKPANIMLDGDRPKIVDFGVAKHLGARSAITTGRMIGTLAYMAPEQLSSGMIAPCTDIWALGVILFEAIAGKHPFENFDDGRCAQLFDEPARVSAIVDVSPELDAIVAGCLSRDPARRPTAEELARLLRGEVMVDVERITVDAGPVGTVPLHAGPSSIGADAISTGARGADPISTAPVASTSSRAAGPISTAASSIAAPRVGRYVLAGLASIAIGAAVALVVTRGSGDTQAAPSPPPSSSTPTSPATPTSPVQQPVADQQPVTDEQPDSDEAAEPVVDDPLVEVHEDSAPAKRRNKHPRKHVRKTTKDTKDTKDKKETLD